jgi:hypothetical protein
MSEPIRDKVIYGLVGVSLLILGLYIGYRYLGFVEDSGIPFLSNFWRLRYLNSLIKMLMFLILGCLVSVLVFVIISNFLSLAYNSLTNAITGAWPNRDWVVYIGLGRNAFYGLWAVVILFSVGAMLYGTYILWDPHIGEWVSKDDLVDLKIENIVSTDELEKYHDCDNVAGTVWKFIILDYYISAQNKTKPISMTAGDIVDENDISYSNYYNDCLPKEYYYRLDPTFWNHGKLVYKIPINAVPGKIRFSVYSNTSEFTSVEISLHRRRLL